MLLCVERKNARRIRLTLPDITFEGGAKNAQNLSAQKASASEGARLQKENENAERKKCTEKKTCQRQKTAVLLIFQNQQITGGAPLGVRLPDPATETVLAAVGRRFFKAGTQYMVKSKRYTVHIGFSAREDGSERAAEFSAADAEDQNRRWLS